MNNFRNYKTYFKNVNEAANKTEDTDRTETPTLSSARARINAKLKAYKQNLAAKSNAKDAESVKNN